MPDDKQFSGDGLGLPYSLEAEQAVLGAILVEPSSIHTVADGLRVDHFYLPEHQAIYRVMSEKLNDNRTIDFVTVLESLKSDGFFAGEEGKAYLMKLAQMVPFIPNLPNYMKIVRDSYNKRRLILASREIIGDAMDPTAEADELLESAEQKIYDIRQGKQTGGLLHIGDVIASNYEMYTKLNSSEREKYLGIPTGISALDEMISGLYRSNLIIVGARPGMGKTSFLLNVARNVALQQNRKVAFFNLEMTREQMVNRLLSGEARVPLKHLITGTLSADEWNRVAAVGNVLCKLPIYLDESGGITVPEMKARLRRLGKPDLVIVDYLGLIQGTKRTENRVQEVSEITRSLKIMAKELDVPVMVASQLSRNTEKQSGNHRPALSDLRESGSIEQDADQVLFIYREAYYPHEQKDAAPILTDTAEIIVAKNRHGEQGTVPLAWQGEFTQFLSVDKRSDTI